MPDQRSDDYLTAREAASVLRVTEQHARLLVRNGAIQGHKHGRDWFLDPESVSAFKGERSKRSEPDRVREPQAASLFTDPDLRPIVNVASVPKRSPFRYPGGKTWLIPYAREWLASLASPKVLVEPFAGGAGIGLMAVFEDLVDQVLLVELDPFVSSVWSAILSDQGPEFADRVRTFNASTENIKNVLSDSPTCLLDRAFQSLVQNRVSRGGILAPGAGLIKTGEAGRGMTSRWYPETLAKRIEEIHLRRSRIRFRHGDGMEAIRQSSCDATVAFFIDPPYPVAGKRLYLHHSLDHRLLFDQLAIIKGSFLATYDDNSEIAALALERSLATDRIPMKSTHHRKKMELIVSRDLAWLGPRVPLSKASQKI